MSIIQPQSLNIAASVPTNLGLSTSSPSHPQNLLYTTAALQQQALANTKYDVPTTEGFCNCNSAAAASTLGAAGVAAILFGIVAFAMLGNK